MRSLFDQMEQVLGSITYDDTKALGLQGAAEASLNLEEDLNYLRSVVKAITGKANWFDAPAKNLETLSGQTNPDSKMILEPVQLNGIAVAQGAASFELDLAGQAIDVEADHASTGYAVQLDGLSVLEDRNVVEIRAINGDPIDAGDGFKLFGKLEVSAAIAALPAAIANAVDSKFVVKLYKLDATGAMVAAAMPAAETVSVLVRRQIALGSVQKEAFVSNASFFDVAQEANIGNLNYTQENYVADNETLTLSIDKLDQALKLVDDEVAGHTATDLPNIRAFLGMDDNADITPDYAAVVGAEAGAIDAAALPDNLSVESIVGRLRNAAINLQGQLDTAKTELNQAIADASAVKTQAVVPAGGYAVNAEVTVPEYTVDAGAANLDVYFIGQLLTAGQDYTEGVADVNGKATKITTLFNMREGRNLIFVVRK